MYMSHNVPPGEAHVPSCEAYVPPYATQLFQTNTMELLTFISQNIRSSGEIVQVLQRSSGS